VLFLPAQPQGPPTSSEKVLMAVHARRKLVLAQNVSEQPEDATSPLSIFHHHCHSVGRTISRLQQATRSTDRQLRKRKGCQKLSKVHPFASISFCASSSHIKPGKQAIAMQKLHMQVDRSSTLHVMQSIRKAGVTQRHFTCLHQRTRKRSQLRLMWQKLLECQPGE